MIKIGKLQRSLFHNRKWGNVWLSIIDIEMMCSCSSCRMLKCKFLNCSNFSWRVANRPCRKWLHDKIHVVLSDKEIDAV